MIYRNCKWCDGFGVNGQACNQCDSERIKAEADFKKKGPQPIFSADLNNPEDMKLLKEVLGKDALEHAFSPGGGGIREIEHNAAVGSFLQTMRKEMKRE